MCPQCPLLRSLIPRMVTLGPEHPDTLARPLDSSAQARKKPVNVVEIAARSSALEGMKVREVTATAIEDPADLTEFLCKTGEVDGDDCDELGGMEEAEEEEEAVPVMAGEKARRFSELSSEFDGEAGPATQRCRHEEADHVAEISPEARKIRQAVSKAPCRPIRMMVGRDKFDFLGAFQEAPFTGLNWGSFFNLAPSVKR